MDSLTVDKYLNVIIQDSVSNMNDILKILRMVKTKNLTCQNDLLFFILMFYSYWKPITKLNWVVNFYIFIVRSDFLFRSKDQLYTFWENSPHWFFGDCQFIWLWYLIKISSECKKINLFKITRFMNKILINHVHLFLRLSLKDQILRRNFIIPKTLCTVY